MDQSSEQEIDIHDGIENTLLILGHRLKRGIKVTREFDRTLPRICAFGSELNQVWTNLIVNAIDAMGETGELQIRTARDGNGLLVEIVDSGPGIPTEAQPHIFEPFFTTKPVGQGTGLGLDTANRIVRKHRGTLRFDSRPGTHGVSSAPSLSQACSLKASGHSFALWVGVFSVDPAESALEAGLRYVSGCGPCIQRIRRGKSFRYRGTDGKPLRDPKHLERVRSLAIPPAWKNVWICPSPNGHLQAIGWDARGRKQYRYHPKYREVRDQAKFSRMLAFGAVLALIRKRVAEDLARVMDFRKRKCLPQWFVCWKRLLFGWGTMSMPGTTNPSASRRCAIDTCASKAPGSTFRFRGKSGQDHEVELTDRRLARVVRECQDLPGYELFEYVDESGQVSRVDSSDVNQYIREITGQDFTAKDFRTWAGTVIAALELNGCEKGETETAIKRTTAAAVKNVARRLGNRPATCRKYYIHPAILDAYGSGDLFARMKEGERQDTAYAGLGLRPEEYCVMVLIADHQLAAARVKP